MRELCLRYARASLSPLPSEQDDVGTPIYSCAKSYEQPKAAHSSPTVRWRGREELSKAGIHQHSLWAACRPPGDEEVLGIHISKAVTVPAPPLHFQPGQPEHVS